MTVSILIVNWNGRDALARSLAALAAHAAASDIETIVVDNASRDGSAEMVRRDFPGVLLFAEPTNLGFAGGVNLARRRARGRHLLLLNPDAEPKPGAVRRLSAALDAEPSVGAVAGRLVDAGGRGAGRLQRAAPADDCQSGVRSAARSHLWPRNPVSSRYYARDLDLDAPADVEQPAAAALMVRQRPSTVSAGSTSSSIRPGGRTWISAAGCSRRAGASVSSPRPCSFTRAASR